MKYKVQITLSNGEILEDESHHILEILTIIANEGGKALAKRLHITEARIFTENKTKSSETR